MGTGLFLACAVLLGECAFAQANNPADPDAALSFLASVPQPNSSRLRGAEKRQVSVPVSSGRFAAAVTWTVDDETSLDVLRGKIEYRPGHRGLARALAPASLADYPFGWDVVERISLESCARCVESGEFLACAQWGARWPIQGRRSIDPIRVRQSPSKTFFAALRRFEQYYTKIPPLEAPTLRSSVTSRGFTGK
jgi:hypothetical protein